MQQQVSNINEVSRTLFGQLVEMITLKGAENKMVPLNAIAIKLKAVGVEQAHLTTRVCLDKLIRCKYVRYYRVNNTLFFGTTALGREKWTALTSKKEVVEEISDVKEVVEVVKEVKETPADKVACRYCGKYFTKRGINRHEKTCKERK